MATPTDILRLERQTTGSNANTWGDVTNVNLMLLEDAIAGIVEIATTGGTTTLTTANGSAVYGDSDDEARFAILKITGTLVSNATIVIPAVSKIYHVWNATSGAFIVTIKVAGTGEVVTQGKRKIIVCDGVEVYSAFTDTGVAGDCSTNTATSVDGELALFSSTTGKLLKRASATGLIKAASGVVAAATANQDYLGVSVEINTQLTTAYTFVLSDAYNKYCRFNNAAAITLTVPPNASVAFPVGTVLNIRRVGTGTITFVAGSGVTVNNRVGLLLDGNHDSARLIQVSANEWDLVGPFEMPDVCTDLACTSAANTWTGPQRGAYATLNSTVSEGGEIDAFTITPPALSHMHFYVNGTELQLWREVVSGVVTDLETYTYATYPTIGELVAAVNAGSSWLAVGVAADSESTVGTLVAVNTTLISTTQTITMNPVAIAVDLDLSNNYSHTLTENTTLAAPTHAVAGQSGVIHFTQHASAAKTLAFNAFWQFGTTDTHTMTTTLSGTAVMSYIVDPVGTSATCSLVNKA